MAKSKETSEIRNGSNGNNGVERGSYDDLMKVIRNRRTVRTLAKGNVSEKDVERILEAGRWSPSGGNMQPWSFLVIRDLAKIKELSDLYEQDRQLILSEHEKWTA